MDAFVNGIRLFYERTGEGRPLVLLHGNGEDHTIFDEAVEVLSNRFTCYAIDSRGHGQSDEVDELHYADMASDLLAFIGDLIVCGANTHPKGLKRAAYLDILREHRQMPSIYTAVMLREPHIPASDLRAIHAHTLVVAGSRDIIRESDTRYIAGAIPGAELLILPGEDHGSYIVHSDRISQIILDFCL